MVELEERKVIPVVVQYRDPLQYGVHNISRTIFLTQSARGIRKGRNEGMALVDPLQPLRILAGLAVEIAPQMG
ncbi:hypothetical protein GGU45_004320 [Niabella hirudinis]